MATVLDRQDHRGRDLRGVDLRGLDVPWRRLRPGASPLLPSLDFEGADLRGAILSGAHLTLVNFRGTRLGGADLGESVFEACSFAYSDLLSPSTT